MSKLPTYSLARHLDAVLGNGEFHSPEASVHSQIEREFGSYAMPSRGRYRNQYVPWSAFNTRDLTTANMPILGQPVRYTDGVCQHAAPVKLGATVLAGLTDNVRLETTTALAQPDSNTVAETANPNSSPVFSDQAVNGFSKVYGPQRVSCNFKISRSLLALSPNVLIPTIRELISRSISSKVSDLSLFGTPNNTNIAGLFQVVAPQNLGATPATYSQVVGCYSTTLASDAQADTLGAYISPGFFKYAEITQRFSAGGTTILDGMRAQGAVVIGNESVHTQTTSQNLLAVGIWRQLSIMLWNNGAEVIWDDITLSDLNQVKVTVNFFFNVGVTLPSAFYTLVQT